MPRLGTEHRKKNITTQNPSLVPRVREDAFQAAWEARQGTELTAHQALRRPRGFSEVVPTPPELREDRGYESAGPGEPRCGHRAGSTHVLGGVLETGGPCTSQG